MSARSRLRSWIAASVRRTSLEEAHDDEWQSHIEQRADDLERIGLARHEALRIARAEFGSLEARRDESRDAIGLRLLDDLRADLRYALRMLRQSPTFTTVAVLSLALGIGANSAMFSLMESVLWKTLPVASPERLRQLSWVSGPELVMGSTWGNLSPTDDGGKTSGSFSYRSSEGAAAQRHLGGTRRRWLQVDWPADGGDRRPRRVGRRRACLWPLLRGHGRAARSRPRHSARRRRQECGVDGRSDQRLVLGHGALAAIGPSSAGRFRSISCRCSSSA